MKLTIIARADLTGLGIQSRNWVRLLKPHRVVVIDSRPFNNNEQHFEWYKDYTRVIINGFIQNGQIDQVLNDTDVLLTFEIPYNYELFAEAKKRGIKTILQNNWEFTDYLMRPELPLPDLMINHSYWHLDEQKKRWTDITDYCPTPLFVEDYQEIYEHNLARSGKRRFVHIAGRKTHKDRNGTEDLMKAVALIPQDVEFELVIKTQTTDVPILSDPRIVVDSSSPVDEKELYRDFDVMILPRRYAGASLPMNEALASGLPVVMTDIDPNNQVLPETWLVRSTKEDEFMARTMIDVYSAIPDALARKIQSFAETDGDDLYESKLLARSIAEKEYSSESVKNRWDWFMEYLSL